MGKTIIMKTRAGRDDFHVVPKMRFEMGTRWPKFGFLVSLTALAFLPALILTPVISSRADTSAALNQTLSTTNAADVLIETNSEPTWSFSASLYGYIVPDSREYVQPTVTADHGMLHLEARYNYENLKTGSLWVGCNFGGGERITWELTPMLGGVIGNTAGI